MKSKSVPSAKITRRFLSVLLAGAMLLSLSACGQKISRIDEAKPVTVERDQGPLAAQTANEAVALTLRQYVNARLITESFAAADFRLMSAEEIKEMTDAVALAWETVEVCAFAAQEISDQALFVLEGSSGKQVSMSGQQQARFMTLTANPADASMAAVADSGGRKVDPQAWAENLTKQYDAIKGAQRYKQLAEQLGTDAKSAYEQVLLAQEIIYNKGMADAAFWDKMTKAAQITKTTCKVGLLVTSSIATGGGSVTLLEGAGFIANGLDCVVEVADTGSTIMLGEGNKIAAAFGDIKDKIAPVSSVIGLLSLNPSSLTTKTKDTADALVYISDSFLDWFNEGKVMGVQVSQAGDGKVSVTGQMINVEGMDDAKAEAALKDAGFTLPQAAQSLSELAAGYELDPGLTLVRMDALVSQMTEIALAVEKPEIPSSSTESSSVSGLYSASGTVTVWDSTDPIKDFRANVVQDGNSMTISFTNDSKTVLTGTYDSATRTFVGRDTRVSDSGKASVWWQWGDTTIRFDTAGATGRLIVHPLENDLIDSDIIVDFTMVRMP